MSFSWPQLPSSLNRKKDENSHDTVRVRGITPIIEFKPTITQLNFVITISQRNSGHVTQSDYKQNNYILPRVFTENEVI